MFRKRTIIIILVLTMVLVFGISANAFADDASAPSFVIIGGKTLYSTQYMDCNGDIGYREPVNGFAYYEYGEEYGKLTLNNFVYESDKQYLIRSYVGSFQIDLVGKNSLTNTSSKEHAAAINVISGNIEIIGDGSLEINMKENSIGSAGISMSELTFGKATLVINCGENTSGIKVEDDLTINSGNINITVGDRGINASGITTINGGFIKVEGQNGAICAPLSEVAAEIPIKAGDSWDALTEYTSLSDAANAKCVEIGTESKPEPESEPESDVPKTADTNRVLLYSCIAFTSILLLGVAIRNVRRNQ